MKLVDIKESGYYWMKNISDTIIWRPVDVLVVEKAYMWGGRWYGAGIHICLPHHDSYLPSGYFLEGWDGLEFFPLMPPLQY